jgi:hypothetical protein
LDSNSPIHRTIIILCFGATPNQMNEAHISALEQLQIKEVNYCPDVKEEEEEAKEAM